VANSINSEAYDSSGSIDSKFGLSDDLHSMSLTKNLTEIPQGNILFNENRNIVSLQHMYTLGVPNICHRRH
jgi:hypothetical protein